MVQSSKYYVDGTHALSPSVWITAARLKKLL